MRLRTLPALLLPVCLLAACGDSDGDSPTATDESSVSVPSTELASTPDTSDSSGTESGSGTEKPEVELPETIPTELAVTVLTPGSGHEAVTGDTVVVDYVGVLSEDGSEFDNSYDRGQPYPVALGSNSVIAGWEEGLVGAQTGARIQLDIPGDLAYGEAGSPPDIPANAALTFVVDVRTVVPQIDPADAPTDINPPSAEGITDLTLNDVVEGEGEAIEVGDTIYIQYLLYNSEGQLLLNSWEQGGSTQSLTLEEEVPQLQGLVDGLIGMKPGGRRSMVIPSDLALGKTGDDQVGVKPNETIVMIVDLLAAY